MFSTLRTLCLEIQESPTRLDLALLKTLREENPELSRRQIKTWFQEKKIFLGNKAVSGSLILLPGSHLIELKECAVKPALICAPLRQSFLPVIYEDEEILVLHKKSGVPSLPQNPMETGTAVESALAHFPRLAGIGKTPLECGLVHRLDTETSGILVFAKDQEEWLRLRKLWKLRQVKKIYRARVVLLAPLPKTPFLINLPLAHDAKSSKKMIALKIPLSPFQLKFIRGKPLPAITRILSCQPSGDFEIEIETGVMHQIRCHLSSQGWPLLGDRIYYPAAKHEPDSSFLLHAWKLKFALKTGVVLSLEASLPPQW
jgi:23S rRNA pseudouridine1911/1915/1917 synthase